MSYRVLIPEDISNAGKEFLKEKGFEVIVTGKTDFDSLRRDVVDCDAILARTCLYPSDIFSCAPRLKCLARHGIGYDNVDVKAAEEAGVYVCITPGVTANAVAEHTLMLILACTKNLINHNAQLRLGNWNYRNISKGTELNGKTLGIVGFGSIGRMVAKKAYYGFDMNVIAYGPRKPKDNDHQEYAAFTSDLDELLKQADIVSLHLPSRPETRHFFGQEQFRKMKSDSIFINTARGDVVVEEDLYHALTDGTLHMAGLDVFANEPCSSENPILNLDNVIATPHNAALTYETMDQLGLNAAMEIQRVLTGKEPLWPVNHPR